MHALEKRLVTPGKQKIKFKNFQRGSFQGSIRSLLSEPKWSNPFRDGVIGGAGWSG